MYGIKTPRYGILVYYDTVFVRPVQVFYWKVNHTTLPETNVAPENRPSGKGDSYWKPPFSSAMLVSGRVNQS